MSGEISPEPERVQPSNGHGPNAVNGEDVHGAVPVQIIQPQGEQGPTLMDILSNPEAVKAITEMINKWMETYAKVSKPKVEHASWRLIGIFIIILVVIGSSTVLSLYGKMDGSSLTFLYGAIVGSLITFVSKLELGQ